MKVCSRCSIQKPATEFYKALKRKDGLQVWCKSCRKKYVIDNYEIVSGAIRRWQEAHPEARVVYGKRERLKNAAKIAAAAKRRRELSPDQNAAHLAIGTALRSGRLVPEPCWVCGAKAEAHHSSYAPDMRFAVTWLCRKHHMQTHREHKILMDGLAKCCCC